MAYVLATTEQVVRWYSFDMSKEVNESNYKIIDQLDLREVPMAGDKATAKSWAKSMRLKTWRYVRI